MVKFKDLLKEVILEGHYENLDEENIDEGIVKNTLLTVLLSLGLSSANAEKVANTVPKNKIDSVTNQLKKINTKDTTKYEKINDVIGSIDSVSNTVVVPPILNLTPPSGYKETTEKQRQEWADYLEYLDKKGLKGSTELDRGTSGGSTRGKDEFKKYLKEHPEVSLTLEMIPIIQYEFKLLKNGREGFGVDEELFQRFKQIRCVVIPSFMYTKKSDKDGNPGSVTTGTYYPYNSSTKTFDIKSEAKRYAGTPDSFKKQLDRTIEINASYRKANPDSKAKEQEFINKNKDKSIGNK